MKRYPALAPRTARYGLLLGLLLLVGCGATPEPKAESDAPKRQRVRLMPLQAQQRAEPVLARGQFTTEDETVHAFKLGGVIERIYVREGDYVRPGQLLAQLYTTEILSMVTQARLGLEKAERDLQRVQNLHRDQVATQEQLQNAQTARDLARQQLEAAEFNLKYAEIRALEPGYVLRKFAAEGQIVDKGTPILQTNGARAGGWVLKVSVSDAQWARVQVGDLARIQTSARPELPLSARVVRKGELAHPLSGTLDIYLQLERLPADFVPAAGLYAEAQIQTRQLARVYAIPTEALLEGHNLEGFVFMTEDGQTVQRRRVTLASLGRDSLYVEGSFQPQAQLVVAGSAYLQHGDRIQP